MNEWTSSEAGASPAILKISWNKELDKVLSIKVYAEVTKRNGDDYELESLKITQSAIERYLKEKNYPLGIWHLREFITQKKSIAELQ